MKLVFVLLRIMATTNLAQSQGLTVIDFPKDAWNERRDADIYYEHLFGESTQTRFQQLFPASAFSQAIPGGGRLVNIFFRLDRQFVGSSDGYYSGLELSFGIRKESNGNLSPVFAENLSAPLTGGLDRMSVNRIFLGPTAPTSTVGVSWNLSFPQESQIVYDPGEGDLLMDFTTLNIPVGSLFDYSTDPDAATSIAISSGATSSVVGKVNRGGFVVSFAFEPVPEPSAAGLLLTTGAIAVGIATKRRR